LRSFQWDPSRLFNYRIKVFNINYRSGSCFPECSFSGLKKESVLCFTKYLGKNRNFKAYSLFWNLFWKLFNRICLLLQAAAIGSRKALKTTKQLLLHQTHIMSFRGKYLRQYFKRGYVRKLKSELYGS
jgi:hypothetical protein